MRNDLIELVFVVDRSGSMESIYQAATDGFKEYIKTQALAEGDITLSIFTFDNIYQNVLDRVSLKDLDTQLTIAENLSKWFEPRGATALYDAMGTAIKTIGAKLSSTPEDQRPGKVMFITITDGFENASRQYSRESLRQMIELQKNTYSWDFIFIGANQDAVLTAQNLGIDIGSAMTFNATEENTRAVYASLDRGTLSTRKAVAAGASASYAFSEEDREAAIDSGT